MDIYSGPGQNLSGKDNIGDTNYTNIAGGAGAVDEYPLYRELVWWTGMKPEINLISPANNSYFERGVIIKFDIWDSNYDIKTVRYTVNGGFNRYFAVNYEINTSVSTFYYDDLYIIEVIVEDMTGNVVKKQFNFNIDTNPKAEFAQIEVEDPDKHIIATSLPWWFFVWSPDIDPEYSISGAKINDYSVIDSIEYYSWLRQKGVTLFLLQR